MPVKARKRANKMLPATMTEITEVVTSVSWGDGRRDPNPVSHYCAMQLVIWILTVCAFFTLL